MPAISAVIINYNGGEDLLVCVEHLRSQSTQVEIIVVDNSSTDGSAVELRRRFPDVPLLSPGRNLGYAGGANHGARAAGTSNLLFMNPDVYLDPGAVESIIAQLEDGAGVVGPALEVEASGRSEFGAVIDVFCYPRPLTSPGSPLYVPGSALAISRQLFEMLGGFDERLFMFVEDVDLCWRALLNGADVRIDPEAMGWHRGAGSTPGGYGREGRKRPSRFRLAMRERNSLTTILKCASAAHLLLVPLYLAQSLLTAVVSLLLLRPGVAADILRGIAWNVAQLPKTISLRRQIPVSKDGRRKASSRIVFTSYKLETVVKHGLPLISR